jgi:hypothetical protein
MDEFRAVGAPPPPPPLPKLLFLFTKPQQHQTLPPQTLPPQPSLTDTIANVSPFILTLA